MDMSEAELSNILGARSRKSRNFIWKTEAKSRHDSEVE